MQIPDSPEVLLGQDDAKFSALDSSTEDTDL